ncbi:uncharacterized protein LOC113310188 [Papaver somniferum]|uniref:uncharacterized protein LOC113310188 n=1 Tax=Papaver somniferum TaxID=3469 RepID=UPI000E7015AB|nr:uncharacterized protein LOC113310188 [Papaver somniferum]XP_026414574.1 uncharacterized protein LOC113310188 [Papaver somniferum]
MCTTPLSSLEQATAYFNEQLYQYLRQLITADGAGFGPLQFRMETLPIKDGGQGIYTMTDTVNYCYLASQFQTQFVQHTILKNVTPEGLSSNRQQAQQTYTQVCGIVPSSLSFEVDAPPSTHSMHSLAITYFEVVKKQLPTVFQMSVRDNVLWQCNQMKHAQDYLLAIPISGLNQTLGPRKFRSVLCYRLGIPIFAEESRCTSCKREMDIYGDHALHCASEVGIKFRHNLVRDVFVDICFRVGVVDRKEASLGFTFGGNTLLPADLSVYNWESGNDTCFDVAGVSPFTSDLRYFAPGQAISKAVLRKRNKYLATCETHGYNFGILAFTTLGELGEDTVDFLKKLKNCFANNDLWLR